MPVTSTYFHHFLDEYAHPVLILQKNRVKDAILIPWLRPLCDHGPRLPSLMSPKHALHPSLITARAYYRCHQHHHADSAISSFTGKMASNLSFVHRDVASVFYASMQTAAESSSSSTASDMFCDIVRALHQVKTKLLSVESTCGQHHGTN